MFLTHGDPSDQTRQELETFRIWEEIDLLVVDATTMPFTVTGITEITISIV
jgi:hypothetical protein